MSYYFNHDGEPITMQEWCDLLAIDEYRVCAFEDLGSHHVSTVWLGLNHAFMGGPPIIFETGLFERIEPRPIYEGSETVIDRMMIETWRASTYAQAMQCHVLAVEQARVLCGR